MASSTLDLYRDDFYDWTRQQAGALRRLAATRPNAEADWPNLIEEVESLGRSERDAVRSQLRRVIEHCLKLQHAAVADPRRGRLNSIDDARIEIADKLTRSMRREIEPELDDLYRQVLRRVRPPRACPYSFEQVTGGWLPERAEVDRRG